MLFFVTSVKFSYSSISDRNRNPTPRGHDHLYEFQGLVQLSWVTAAQSGETREKSETALCRKSIIEGPGRNEKVSAIKRPVTLIKPPKKMDATMNPFILFATFFATEAGP